MLRPRSGSSGPAAMKICSRVVRTSRQIALDDLVLRRVSTPASLLVVRAASMRPPARGTDHATPSGRWTEYPAHRRSRPEPCCRPWGAGGIVSLADWVPQPLNWVPQPLTRQPRRNRSTGSRNRSRGSRAGPASHCVTDRSRPAGARRPVVAEAGAPGWLSQGVGNLQDSQIERTRRPLQPACGLAGAPYRDGRVVLSRAG